MKKPTPTRIIAIDYGLKRIGIAYSDETKTIASPLSTILAEKKMEATVERLLAELSKHQRERGYEILEIVVGLPLLMSGKKGMITDEVHAFIQRLTESVNAPVTAWDERLTSVQAERSLRESSLSRKKRTSFVDQVSAVIILQSYLDSKKL